MARTIKAIYEDGVLRPLEDLILREREKVEVTVRPVGEWAVQMRLLLGRRSKLSRKRRLAEVSADVATILREVRSKRGRASR